MLVLTCITLKSFEWSVLTVQLVFLDQASDGTLSTINVRFEQEGQSADFNVCREDYVKEMGYSWLDGMTGCGGECILSGSSVTFSNFALKPI